MSNRDRAIACIGAVLLDVAALRLFFAHEVRLARTCSFMASVLMFWVLFSFLPPPPPRRRRPARRPFGFRMPAWRSA